MNSPKSLNRFTTRYAVREVFKNESREMETAIYLTDKKTICSLSDEHRFYAKISGFLNLQDLNSQKVKDIIERIDISGFFPVMTNYRTTEGQNTFALVYPHINTKVLDSPIGPLVSFLPRIDGHTGHVICGLRIHSADDTSKQREWTRFVESPKSKTSGFTELKFGYNYDNDRKLHSRAKYVGFYVNKNSSLLVHDIASSDPNNLVNSEQNRTLIQEGGFVYADVDLLFRVCSEPEDRLYSAKQLVYKYRNNEILGSDKLRRSHVIRDNSDSKRRSIVCFLKSTQLMPFALHITEDVSEERLFKGKRIAILTIPSGNQFEYCEYWSLSGGLQTVHTRQKAEPWKKYLLRESDPPHIDFNQHLNDEPLSSFPTEVRNEISPQNEELYRKLMKVRHRVLRVSESTTEQQPEDNQNTE